MEQTLKITEVVKLEEIDHLPRWAYTDEEWEGIIERTCYVKNGIKYEAIIIPEPETALDQFILDMI